MGGALWTTHGYTGGAIASHPWEELEQGRDALCPEQLSVDRMVRLLVPSRLETEERRILLATSALTCGIGGAG